MRRLPELEGSAANLLYFLVKDHVFADGNKRIAALLYLAFLHKNGMLVKEDGRMAIANDGLAAITILIAESKPEEKEIMVAVTMNMTEKKRIRTPRKAFHCFEKIRCNREKLFISFFWHIVGLWISDAYLSPSHVDK